MTPPLGGRHPRPDAAAKVSGQTRYVGDLELPGMLYAAIATADVASARVHSIDIAQAAAMANVETVLTAADIPGTNQIGVIFPDQPLLVTDRVRMVGDRLALVAARSEEAAWAAACEVKFQLEELPGVFDADEALVNGAPAIHEDGNLIRDFHVRRGDLDAQKQQAKVTVTAEYEVGGQEHAYLEPQGCLAIPEGGRRITIVASCQCPFYVQHAVARVLGLPLAAVRVEQAPTGGAFGGKEDYPSEPAACAAVLAWKTGRPVRLIFPRELDLQVSTKRHAMRVRHNWGADADGKLCFAEVESILDAGAYIGLSTVVAERANVSAIGPYSVPAVQVLTRVAYTNNLFGGAFRGFGAPQVTWAHEATMDRLARQLKLDPVELRRRNLLDDENPIFCTGQELPLPLMARRCLDEAVEKARWNNEVEPSSPEVHTGRGVSTVIYGCNLHHGGQPLDRSSAVVILQPDASVIVRVGLTEMGQGNLVGCQTIAATALGIAPERVEVWQPDTTTVADSGPTVASRGSHASGMAILDAVRRLRSRLDPVAAELLGCKPEDVELEDGQAYAHADRGIAVPLSEVARELAARRLEPIATGWYRSPERHFDAETGLGEPYEFYAFACHVARVEVDRELGLVRVVEVSAAHDVGTLLHRTAAEGQVEGGVVQGVGWALSEELQTVRGRLLNPNFTDYVIPTSADAPSVKIALLESDGQGGPLGAKGLGEPSFIPTAAAIRNAVVDALGCEVDRLPMTPPTLVSAQGENHPYAWLLKDE